MNFIKLYFLLFILSIKLMVLSVPLNETSINEKEIAVDGECNPINKLLRKYESYNCCLEEEITCSNGHITKM